jgi:hypothetical protein
MELFELTKAIFESPAAYSDATKGDKRKNFFMIQRRMAINFPIQAHLLQHIRINMEATIDWWQRYIRSKKYPRTPGWMFIQGVKKNQEKEEKKTKISLETISEYCRFYQKDPKQIKDAIRFYPGEMQKEMNEFQKMLKELR